MLEKKEFIFNRFWFQEVVSLLMKLHPVILFLLGWLDSKESFLVLILGYLIFALRIQVEMAISFVYDYKLHILHSINRSSLSKVGSAISYLIGFLFVLCVWLFIYLIFFGLYYDSVARQYTYGEPGVFDGESGSLLIQTLWINGIYFLILEILHLRKEVKEMTPAKHDLMRAMFLNVPMQNLNKWAAFPMIWLMIFSAGFIFLCTARAFQGAIILYFIFDVGFTFLKRLEKRKNG
ncbi:hypothetical protein [Fluviicola taffensis]|uniref:Uncharacterized protein n=1 Tax=Fluviicola taffensis (strain DSM 16823 / NCIMB 13979 / RW262) TaxID=755732 RepID=F2IC28_FLUTR|nr:hypothetical protein [Fluviicola taffensis]AEA43254.1 hypothetical protein Fluta_1259 [Fluviicola taffensis DSM 16823]